MLSKLKRLLLQWGPIKNAYARLVKRYTTKVVIDTLRIAHAAELANIPGEMWPLTKEKHALQIEAVRDGKLDIIDRRSWQWPYLPSSISRIKQPLIKLTPFNLYRFSQTPVARRAINLIKYSVVALKWDIIPLEDSEALPDQEERIAAAKRAFKHPNNTESFQSFNEAGIEDMCISGAMTIEPQLTPDPDRPVKMWNVDTTTIRIFPTWTESDPDSPRYAQMTGLKGERGAILFLDNELLYIKDNPSVKTPFGTGKMEVAFQSVTSFLGVQDMAGRSGSDQTHRTWLWWTQGSAPYNTEILRRHLTNDIEGQGKINIMQGMPKPDVIDIAVTQPEDLLLEWQEMLIRMIANAFDLSPLALGIEKDVNRSTGEVLDDKDFHSAVVPIAVRLAEAYTRSILHRKLGYTDIGFVFLNLDDPDITTKMVQLSQLFAMNAITSNGVLKSLGLKPLHSPYADLTQFEQILVSMEATSQLADQQAANASQRQSDMQDKQMQQQQDMYEQQYQDQQDPDNVSNQPPPQAAQPASTETHIVKKGATPASGSKTTTPKTPAVGPKKPAISGSAKGITPPKTPKLTPTKPVPMPKLTLPKLAKMPIAGSKYSAAEIAAMNLDEITAAMDNGSIPKNSGQLQQSMEQQQPGILMQMAPEVAKYLEVLKELEEEEEAKNEQKPTSKAKDMQVKRFKKQKHKPTDVENAMYSPRSRNRQDSATGFGKEISTTDLGKQGKGYRK